MAEFTLAAAWPALRELMPAWTNTLASTETVVPEPESATAMLPTDPAATQRPAIRAPSWRRRREKRDRCIEVPFWLSKTEVEKRAVQRRGVADRTERGWRFLAVAPEISLPPGEAVGFARLCPDA